MGLSDRVDLRSLLLCEPVNAAECVYHEGRDFLGQADLPEGAAVGGRRMASVGRNLQRLIAEALREMLLMEIAGQTPGGKPWSEQPAWRVGLWEAFQRARIEGVHER